MKKTASDLDRALRFMAEHPAKLPVEPHGATFLHRTPERTKMFVRHAAYSRVNGFTLFQEVCHRCGCLFTPRSRRQVNCCKGKG